MSPFYDPFKGNGRIMYSSPDKVVWCLDVGDQLVTCVQRRVDLILDDNARALNDSAGTRWNDGRVAASIPLDLYFEHIVPARQAGDEKWIRRWINDSDHSKFRRFGGKI